MTTKSDRTTVKLTDNRGPDESTAAAGSKEEEKTWNWRGREEDAPREQREPEHAGPVALPGPPPPAPPRRAPDGGGAA